MTSNIVESLIISENAGLKKAIEFSKEFGLSYLIWVRKNKTYSIYKTKPKMYGKILIASFKDGEKCFSGLELPHHFRSWNDYLSSINEEISSNTDHIEYIKNKVEMENK